MISRFYRSSSLVLSFLFLFYVSVGLAHAQTPAPAQTSTGTLSGQVTDPSGAAIGGGTVLLVTPAGDSLNATTGKDGMYEFKGLAPGNYTVKAVADGFALFTQENVVITAGQAQKINIALTIEEQKQKIEVTDSTTNVSVDPSNNAGMIVMKGKDLEALSDDPDELQSELQALAGPSAGPNGGQIYIDGFTAGTLPPKASIREIRVNQNPFSAEYDKLGYGRIEIFTKPGTDTLHGQLFISGNSSAFNARNPFEIVPDGTSPPSYESTQVSGNVGGAINKKASWFFNIERRDTNNLNIVSAQTLDLNTFQYNTFSDAVPNPNTRTNLSPRLDYQLSTNNTLTVRYQYYRENESNDGVGQFNLASQGYNTFESEQTLQVTDTQVVNTKTINETRFQFIRGITNQTPVSTDPALSVQGAFTQGGSSNGETDDAVNRYELQNLTSISMGKHFIKFGGRFRDNRDSNFATSNFNGSFTFGSRPDPSCIPPAPLAPNTCTEITGAVAYQQLIMGLANPPGGVTPAQNLQNLIAEGFGPSRYSVTVLAGGTANPALDVNWLDVGLYAQDDWHVRSNITFSYGLRFESQNDFGDHADVAPRLGLAWGVGGNAKNPPKTVIRAGYGWFYDRFQYSSVLEQERLNGLIQQQYIVTNPDFYLGSVPPIATLQTQGATAPTIYKNNPDLRAPVTMQTGISVERQLTKYANLSMTYLNSRGVHVFYTNNINAPDLVTGLRPNGINENIYQFQSGGIFKQNQFIANSSVRMGTKVSLFGYYTLNYANSNTSGIGSFPSNPVDLEQDYGRASFDIRQRVFFGGTVGLKYGLRLSPFMIASSGIPFNITDGQDLYGDSLFNSRPSFASCSSTSTTVKNTKFGCFDTNPAAGAALIPIYDATGPGRFSLNLRVSKTFGFGKKVERAGGSGGAGGPGAGGTFGRGPGGPGGRGGGGRGPGGPDGPTGNQRYNLTISASARNIFNNVNLATPIGDLSSPLFGQSNGLAGQPYSSSTSNRRIDLQMTFTF